MAVAIRGTGSFLPERVLTNDELESMVDDFDRTRAGCSLDEWVFGRIGVASRHRAEPGMGTTAMALAACRAALDDADLAPDEVDLIVLSTSSTDHRFPQTGSMLQRDLGTRAKSIEIASGCTGFVEGVAVAMGLMTTLGYENVLVVHSELMLAMLDTRRFLMQAIFGDGAGAVVLQPSDDGTGIRAVETFTDGSRCEWLRAGGGSLSPRTTSTVEDGSYFLDIDVAAILPFAIEKMSSTLGSIVHKSGARIEDVDWVVAHQTGINISRGVAASVGVDISKFLMTLHHTGNTSGATIPIALDHFNRQGTFSDGDFIVMPSVGAGMAWGGIGCTWVETAAGKRAKASAMDELSLLMDPSLSLDPSGHPFEAVAAP